jgi:UDP-N-acetylmuramate-alanine ligase
MIFLCPVYAASEAPIDGVSERSIGEPLARTGADVRYVALDELPGALLKAAPDGALVLMLGAGNITTIAAQLAQRVQAAEVTT